MPLHYNIYSIVCHIYHNFPLPVFICTPGLNKPPLRKNKEQNVVSTTRKRDFIKSHLAHVTKSDQYEAMKNFENKVMNLPDASDKGLLTGDRIVRKLRKQLKRVSAIGRTDLQCGERYLENKVHIYIGTYPM